MKTTITAHSRAFPALCLGLCIGLFSALSPAAERMVTKIDDDNTVGTLRKEIADATAGDTIVFDDTLNGDTIILGGSELTIGKNLTIDASALSEGITISGNDASRVFQINSATEVTMKALTISDGVAPEGTGNTGVPGEYGGGIYNDGNLIMEQCTVTNNRAGRGGMATGSGDGGDGGDGGGIFNGDTLVMRQCTVSGNEGGDGGFGFGSGDGGVGGDGGGISVFGTLTLEQCTVTNNRGGEGGDGQVNGGNGGVGGNGGGIDRGFTYVVEISDSIVAGNFVGAGTEGAADGQGPDLEFDFQTTSTGINLIGDNTLFGGSPSTVFPAGPTVGTSSNPLDPVLANLADNGGPTLTHLPLRGSPALNPLGGATVDSTFSNDQRGPGFERVIAGIRDIGAVEATDYASIDAQAAAEEAARAAAAARSARQSDLSKKIAKLKKKFKNSKRKGQASKAKKLKKQIKSLTKQMRAL